MGQLRQIGIEIDRMSGSYLNLTLFVLANTRRLRELPRPQRPPHERTSRAARCARKGRLLHHGTSNDSDAPRTDALPTQAIGCGQRHMRSAQCQLAQNGTPPSPHESKLKRRLCVRHDAATTRHRPTRRPERQVSLSPLRNCAPSAPSPAPAPPACAHRAVALSRLSCNLRSPAPNNAAPCRCRTPFRWHSLLRMS